MGSSGTGKEKVVEMSLCGREKKKQQRKVATKKAAVDNNDMEVVERLGKAGLSKKSGGRTTGREGMEKYLNQVVDALGDLIAVICGLAANHVQLTCQTQMLSKVAIKFVLWTFDEYMSESEGSEEYNKGVW